MSAHDHHGGRSAVSPALLGAAREGCREARMLLSRRSMLGLTAALFSSAFLPRFSYGATDPDARLLVVILRGGMDGIGMAVPKLDPRYEELRGRIAMPFDSTLSLGTDFGLHPALARVHSMYQAGHASIVPAAGIPLLNRSHFECQDNLENGLPANTVNATGWLNRLLGSLPEGDPIRNAKGLEIGEAPLILRGSEPVLGWSPTWFEKSDPGTLDRLDKVYSQLDPALGNSLALGIAADELALAAGADSGDISYMRKGFIGAARLMRAETGPRIAVLSVDGWDMHADEGIVTGYFNDHVSELDQALGDFQSEIGAAWTNTVAICVSEFGRTVRVNGDRGTDHGLATVALMVGGALQAGVHGDWPGLADDQLLDGDLRPTVDLRQVFKGLARDHLGVPSEVLEATVFPDSGDFPALSGLVSSPQPAARMAARLVPPPTLQELSPIARYRRAYGT